MAIGEVADGGSRWACGRVWKFQAWPPHLQLREEWLKSCASALPGGGTGVSVACAVARVGRLGAGLGVLECTCQEVPPSHPDPWMG